MLLYILEFTLSHYFTMNNNDSTTTRLKCSTLNKLKSYFSEYGDTVDVIVQKLMDNYDKTHKPKKRNNKGQFIKRSNNGR